MELGVRGVRGCPGGYLNSVVICSTLPVEVRVVYSSRWGEGENSRRKVEVQVGEGGRRQVRSRLPLHPGRGGRRRKCTWDCR